MNRHRVRKLPAARGMSAIMIAGGISAALGAAAVPAVALAASMPTHAAPAATTTLGPEVARTAGAALFRQHAVSPVRHHQARRVIRAAASRTVTRPPLDPQQYAQNLVAARGWSSAQWTCLDALWLRESGWNPYAVNYNSGAYGIPQALPGWKMSSVASDWRTNPDTQIQWGVQYIAAAYGTPCGALTHSNYYGFY